VGQPASHAFAHAVPACKLTRYVSSRFRLLLQYHLAVPLVGFHPSVTDHSGDLAVHACAHGYRHGLVLTQWHRAAVRAYGAAVVTREPKDYSAYSPGYKPDLHIDGQGHGGHQLVADIKTGSPFVDSITSEQWDRAATIGFAGTADRFVADVLGQPQVGRPGGGVYSHATGTGYIAESLGDYRGAHRHGTEVVLLLSEIFGGLHYGALQFMKRMRATLAARLGKPAAAGFMGDLRMRLSCATAQGLAFELEHGMSLVNRKALAPAAA
jgi:hypothetical protein